MIDSKHMDYITKLGEEFVTAKVPHGQLFDHKKRWCAICNETVLVCVATVSNPYADKMCTKCDAIWPEFEQELLDLIDGSDDDFIEDTTS
jgi:hypothetical protein